MHRETYSTPNLSPPLVGHTFAPLAARPSVLSNTNEGEHHEHHHHARR